MPVRGLITGLNHMTKTSGVCWNGRGWWVEEAIDEKGGSRGVERRHLILSSCRKDATSLLLKFYPKCQALPLDFARLEDCVRLQIATTAVSARAHTHRHTNPHSLSVSHRHANQVCHISSIRDVTFDSTIQSKAASWRWCIFNINVWQARLQLVLHPDRRGLGRGPSNSLNYTCTLGNYLVSSLRKWISKDISTSPKFFLNISTPLSVTAPYFRLTSKLMVIHK